MRHPMSGERERVREALIADHEPRWSRAPHAIAAPYHDQTDPLDLRCVCGESWPCPHRYREASRWRAAYWQHRVAMGGWHDAPSGRPCQDECWDDIAQRAAALHPRAARSQQSEKPTP